VDLDADFRQLTVADERGMQLAGKEDGKPIAGERNEFLPIVNSPVTARRRYVNAGVNRSPRQA
jgi:hypothetical protein